jgi:hypothetical protein
MLNNWDDHHSSVGCRNRAPRLLRCSITSQGVPYVTHRDMHNSQLLVSPQYGILCTPNAVQCTDAPAGAPRCRCGSLPGRWLGDKHRCRSTATSCDSSCNTQKDAVLFALHVSGVGRCLHSRRTAAICYLLRHVALVNEVPLALPA